MINIYCDILFHTAFSVSGGYYVVFIKNESWVVKVLGTHLSLLGYKVGDVFLYKVFGRLRPKHRFVCTITIDGLTWALFSTTYLSKSQRVKGRDILLKFIEDEGSVSFPSNYTLLQYVPSHL